MTAVLKPCCTSPKAARRPAPPAPTTTASYVWSTTGYSLVEAALAAVACDPLTVKLKFLAAVPEAAEVPLSRPAPPFNPFNILQTCKLLFDLFPESDLPM